MTWHIVVNQMSAIPGDSLGTLISAHRTREAAERAARACQPRERDSYLPVAIYEADRRPAHRHVSPHEVRS
jgi:hypothetical protein